MLKELGSFYMLTTVWDTSGIPAYTFVVSIVLAIFVDSANMYSLSRLVRTPDPNRSVILVCFFFLAICCLTV